MKVLLFLNGPEGWQTGIEDGFNAAKQSGLVAELRCFYLDDHARKHGAQSAETRARELIRALHPDLVVVFHIAGQALIRPIMDCIFELKPRPALVYDEGDMYGGIAKPITAEMRAVIERADVVSIRGLGPFYRKVRTINPAIIYTPHHADLARYDAPPPEWSRRDHFLAFIGNRNKPRFLSALRRLPGAAGREAFVRAIGHAFPERFHLYGDGWNGFPGDRGVLAFEKQMEIYRRSRITVAYEHYPKVSYYFSNRLPMALMSGSLYVCHEHAGYENIFKGKDFIHFFKSTDEAIDIIRYLETVDQGELAARSLRAREFAMSHFQPSVVWQGFLHSVTARLGHRA